MTKFSRKTDIKKLYAEAVKEISPYDCVSVSFLQRRFSLLYKDAEKIMSFLIQKGNVRPRKNSEIMFDVINTSL